MNSTRDSAAPASLVASIDVIAGFVSHDSESTRTSSDSLAGAVRLERESGITTFPASAYPWL